MAAGHFVMGLFKKKWGSQKADGAHKRQIGAPKGRRGAIRQMGCHKADGVPKRHVGRKKGMWSTKKADGVP